MSRFGENLFGGSRFIFWCLGPLFLLLGLILLVVAYFLLIDGHTDWAGRYILFASFCGCFFLALLDPRRFWWASRAVTGGVFCFCVGYVVVMSQLPVQPASGALRNNPTTLPKAIAALVVFGLPCLWYTIFGRFSLSAPTQPPAVADDSTGDERTNGEQALRDRQSGRETMNR